MNRKSVHKLALFGNPVTHSLSPKIHEAFAKQFNLNIDYRLIQVKKDELQQSVIDFFKSGGKGANVTLPHKNSVIDVVQNMTARASLAQAVNTLFLNNKSELCGDNTDGIGFIKDLSKRCHFNCKAKNILILGAGGASQGIMPEIMTQSPTLVVVANRSVQKAQQMCQYDNAKAVSLELLNTIQQPFDLIIHASSLGHQGQTLKFLNQHTKAATIAYDLSYALAAQPFINFSQTLGVSHCYDGIGMLIEQAAAAFQIWFDLKPNTTELFNEEIAYN